MTEKIFLISGVELATHTHDKQEELLSLLEEASKQYPTATFDQLVASAREWMLSTDNLEESFEYTKSRSNETETLIKNIVQNNQEEESFDSEVKPEVEETFEIIDEDDYDYAEPKVALETEVVEENNYNYIVPEVEEQPEVEETFEIIDDDAYDYIVPDEEVKPEVAVKPEVELEETFEIIDDAAYDYVVPEEEPETKNIAAPEPVAEPEPVRLVPETLETIEEVYEIEEEPTLPIIDVSRTEEEVFNRDQVYSRKANRWRGLLQEAAKLER